MVGISGGHDGCGERRDERHQPQAEDDGPRQHVGGPRRAGPYAGEEEQPGAGQQRTDGELGSRADSLRQRARSGREDEHENGDREQRHSRLQRGPAGGDLQLVGDEKERHADRAVEEHGREVHDGEGAVAEQRRRHQWIVGVAHVVNEGGDGDDRHRARGQDRGAGPPARSGLGERPGAGGQAGHGERGAGEVEAPRRVRVAGLGHRRVGAGNSERGDRHVDEERPAPARPVDQGAPDEGPDRTGHTSQP